MKIVVISADYPSADFVYGDVFVHTRSKQYQQVADVHGTARYREAAANVLVQVPAAEIRRSVLCDGIVWDGHAPQAYADAFAIRA